MPTTKPRIEAEVYTPKSCNSDREGDAVTGLCLSLFRCCRIVQQKENLLNDYGKSKTKVIDNHIPIG